jgi:hypothetical protein
MIIWNFFFKMHLPIGPTHFFVTYTSAETRWIALMSSLHMLNKKYINIPKNFDELESNIWEILYNLILLFAHTLL